ncbi:MAG TPA: thiamine pyrophosphate-dependent enzyme, partial [Candidatus Dormibacteraeota bacterium]|nr:thiamine pyrophosphate-dependent enzyme [Candidatus Dormibacteraeota bacterium]
ATRVEELPGLLETAYRLAVTPPSGPTYVEVPFDLLSTSTSMQLPVLDPEPDALPVPDVAAAAAVLSSAPNPVVWAGGGVIRSGAWKELVEVADLLDAPVVTTYMGKGAIPEDHPLSAGSACNDPAFAQLVGKAGVVLCVGTELGAETTSQYQLRFEGQVIQIDAEPGRVGATYPTVGLVGDARQTLRALIPLLEKRKVDGDRRARAARPHAPEGLERRLLHTIRDAVPQDGLIAWDMTILAYHAAAYFPATRPRRFLYPLGSGTLGFAWPAALGAKSVLGETPCLAVAGDGGFAYGMSELASARQHDLDAKLLLVDDGGYGILREYQTSSFEATHGVDLVQPDFEAAVAAYGVPVRKTTPEKLGADLRWALETSGPAAVVLHERLRS